MRSEGGRLHVAVQGCVHWRMQTGWTTPPGNRPECPTNNTVQLTTRRVPIVFREPLKQELDRLSDISLIRKVDSPTEWISAVVITTKKNGQVRLCIDPKPLNEALRRNRYPLPTIDDVLPLLSTARVFTLLDAKNGFWHVQLDIIDITLEGLPGQKAIADNTDEGALEGHDRNLGRCSTAVDRKVSC